MITRSRMVEIIIGYGISMFGAKELADRLMAEMEKKPEGMVYCETCKHYSETYPVLKGNPCYECKRWTDSNEQDNYERKQDKPIEDKPKGGCYQQVEIKYPESCKDKPVCPKCGGSGRVNHTAYDDNGICIGISTRNCSCQQKPKWVDIVFTGDMELDMKVIIDRVNEIAKEVGK